MKKKYKSSFTYKYKILKSLEKGYNINLSLWQKILFIFTPSEYERQQKRIEKVIRPFRIKFKNGSELLSTLNSTSNKRGKRSEEIQFYK